MFGPNAPYSLHAQFPEHHRGAAFEDLMEKLVGTFRSRFRLSKDWLPLFLEGSGTTSVESVAFSFGRSLSPAPPRGKFGERLQSLLRLHGCASEDAALGEAGVLLETSCSNYSESNSWVFVDAISSFPYYQVPPSAKLWSTVSSKIIGGPPVVGIAVVHESAWAHCISEGIFSVLNLARYRAALEHHQTPSTPSIPLLQGLLQRLQEIDVDEIRTRIDRHASMVAEAVGPDNILGDPRGPVLTLRQGAVPAEVAQRFGLYRAAIQGASHQVFTYSESEDSYRLLAEALSEAH